MIRLKNFSKPLITNQEAVENIISDSIDNNISHNVSIVDAVVIGNLIKNHNYKKLLESFDSIICDSSLLIFLYNIKFNKRLRIYNGAEMFRDFMNNTNHKQLLLGSNEISYLNVKNKSLNNNLYYIDVGFHQNYRHFDYSSIENYVKKNKIKIIWVMLGNPKQDYFSFELKKRDNLNSVVISSGAAYLFYTNQISHINFSFLGLKFHWINRLIQNPKIQFKRVFNILKNLLTYYKLLNRN